MVDRISDVIRRTLLFGVGAIAITADRAQEIVNDLVERGEITTEQGRSMVSELMKRGTEARKQLRDMVKVEVKKALDEADVPSRQDIKRLEDKIDRLILQEKGTHAEVHIEGMETGEISPEGL